MKAKRFLFVLMALLTIFPLIGFSVDEPADDTLNVRDEKGDITLLENAAAAPEGFDPAKMAEVKEKSSPNENHQILDPLAGDWTYAIRWRMDPNAEWVESTGTASNKWILDGRFLQQETTGEFMGETFEGLGFTGYDNIRKEYASVWMDSMGTGMMKSTGQYDPTTKTLTESGTFSCPMKDKGDMEFRSELIFGDANSFTYAMYGKADDGTEYKNMEITYTRAGAEIPTPVEPVTTTDATF